MKPKTLHADVGALAFQSMFLLAQHSDRWPHFLHPLLLSTEFK